MRLDWILVLLILSNLRLMASARMGAKIRTVAAQGVLLGLVPLLAGAHTPGLRSLVVALAGMFVKGAVFPWLLHRALRESREGREVQPYIGYMGSLLAALTGLVGALLLSLRLAPFPAGATALLVMAAFFSIYAGLFLIISRKRAINQVLGFLVLENGVFLFAAGVMGRTSLLVEVGILLDVLVAVFVMGLTLFHINREFDHMETDRLTDLRD